MARSSWYVAKLLGFSEEMTVICTMEIINSVAEQAIGTDIQEKTGPAHAQFGRKQPDALL